MPNEPYEYQFPASAPAAPQPPVMPASAPAAPPAYHTQAAPPAAPAPAVAPNPAPAAAPAAASAADAASAAPAPESLDQAVSDLAGTISREMGPALQRAGKQVGGGLSGVLRADNDDQLRQAGQEMGTALRQAGQDLGAALRQVGRQVGPVARQAGAAFQRAAEQTRAAQAEREAREQARRRSRSSRRRMTAARITALFGGTTSGFLGLLFWGVLASMLDGYSYFDAGVAVILALAAGFSYGAFRLFRSAGRWRRARSYRDFLDGWAGCTLKELSSATGRGVDFLKKDIRMLISHRYLRGACLDGRDDVLFADEASYREYLDERRAREQEQKARERERQAQAAQQRRQAEAPPTPPEEVFAGQAGQFLTELAALRAEITDPAVLEQVDQLAGIVGGIRDWVTDHPASLPKVKRLPSYYLPTTLKLLRTYTTVDSNPGPTAQNICQNITGILHTFNTGLLTMQDSLLEDTALDVSAEISVLESMLQQEGLTGTADFAPLAVRGAEDEPPAPDLTL